MAADDGDNTEKVSARGTLSVVLAATLAATDPAVTGPPIALYALSCALVDSTKSLCNRVGCLFACGEERVVLKQRADHQLLQSCFYTSASLIILSDSMYKVCTGFSSNIGSIALAFSGAADD